jgi:D-alanyl-D-alanine carboxypeptidase (penicillin-binding protein 5/6)
MMGLSVRRGRLRALLSFFIALIAVLVTMVGVAWADTTSKLPLREQPLTSTITMSAEQVAGTATVEPAITSPSVLVVNLDSGKVLYKKNETAELSMASTTKIMTAVIVLEKMDLGNLVTISENAASKPELEVWTKPGDVFTVEQLLYSLMVPSHNQAAIALAEAFPGGEAAFVTGMNAKARELGMTGTNYVNPSGLDALGHHSTAADLATLARYAMTSERIGPLFRELVSAREYSLKAPEGQSGSIVMQTTNQLLGQYDWVIGVKTGETPNAKSCLVAAGAKNGMTVLSVVMGTATNGQPDTEKCASESKSLLDYGFSLYPYALVLEKGAAIAEAVVRYEEEPLQIVAKEQVGKGLSKGESLTATVVIDRVLVLPVEAGVQVGRVDLIVGGESVGSVPLVTSRAAAKPTLGTKIARFFEGLF